MLFATKIHVFNSNIKIHQNAQLMIGRFKQGYIGMRFVVLQKSIGTKYKLKTFACAIFIHSWPFFRSGFINGYENNSYDDWSDVGTAKRKGTVCPRSLNPFFYTKLLYIQGQGFLGTQYVLPTHYQNCGPVCFSRIQIRF